MRVERVGPTGSSPCRSRVIIQRIAAVYRAAFSGLPREVWLLCYVLLINRAGQMVLPFLALFFTEARGLSVARAGQLVALYGVGSGIGSFVGGWLSDRLGTLRTLQISLIASGVGYLVFPRLRGWTLIAIAVVLLSIVAESSRPAIMAGVGERTTAALRTRSYALLRLAANLGIAIGPAVGGVLAVYSYDWLFVGEALTCWAAAVLLVVKLGRPRAGSDTTAGRPSTPPTWPWRDGPFLGLLVLIVLVAAVIFQVFTTLPLFLRQSYGYRESTIGLLLGFNALLIVLFEMVLIHWAQDRDKMLLTGLGALLICLGLGLMPLGSSIVFIALTVVVWTTGEMLSLPLTNALVAERAARGSLGRYMGLYTTAFSVAFVVAPIVGTWVLERHGPRVLWFAIGLLGPILGLLAWSLRPAFRPEATP